jgi:RNA polymerase sigma factor (sigma-70 family)
MDDREVVAAIAAGDPAGIAAAYDKYATGLYGYCQWKLHEPTEAAEALRDVFTVAATSGDPPEAPKMRPWLYAVARNECQRRLRATSLVHGVEASADGRAGRADQPVDAASELADATLQFRATQPADTATQFVTAQDADATLRFPAVGPAHASKPIDVTQPIRVIGVSGHPEQADLRTLIRAVLAELEPGEREVIELSLRHDLYDTDLATALGVSWSQAHALTSRARRQLDKDLGELLIAHTGRGDCTALDRLLADWDGQLTRQTRDLVGEHIAHCGICAGCRRGALRPAVLSGLQPLAIPPSGLRDDIVRLCSPAAPDTPTDQPSAEPQRPSKLSAAARALRWGNIRTHPGAAAAAAAVVLWIVAAVSVTLIVLTGSHSAHAFATRPSVNPPRKSPAASRATKDPTSGHKSASPRPSPTASQLSAAVAPSVGPSTTAGGAGPTQTASTSPKPSTSPSPKPSTSPSASGSPKPSPSRSSSPSPSASKS